MKVKINNMTKPKEGEAKFVSIRNAKGLLKVVCTTAQVNGEYYLIQGTSWSNVVSAINYKYQPLLNKVLIRTKNWNEIVAYLSK